MSRFASITQQFRSMNRALQWATLAAVGLGLFLLWDRLLSPASASLARQADALQARVNELRRAPVIVRQFKESRRDQVIALGPVATPMSESQGAIELQNAVNEVLKRHNISNQGLSFDMRTRGRLPSGALVTLTDNKRVDRLAGDLKFVASPEDAAAIIAELESSPIVAAINNLRMTKDAGRKLKVTLSVESWVTSSEQTRGAAAE
jgi:hypothetical protein